MKNINNCSECGEPLDMYAALYCKKCSISKIYELREQQPPERKYKTLWQKKSTSKIETEIKSWEKYIQKHEAAYHWHGKTMTPPGSLSDGEKITILREILTERRAKS